MAVIPSRLAGMGQSAETWLPLIFGAKANPAEQRAAERHQAWRENLAAVKAQSARDAQMQRSAMQQFHGDPNNLRIMGGAAEVPYSVANPQRATWDAGLDYGDDMMAQPQAAIQKSRAVTPMDRYNAHQLYSRAHGSNMPGGSSLARILAAAEEGGGGSLQEARWNAAMSQGGIPFDTKTRKDYSDLAQAAITSAMAEAQAADSKGLSGVFSDVQTDNIDDARRVIMQDAWTVARQIAKESKLIDEGTAFDKIIDAMERGEISPIQISQATGDDAIVGDEGFLRGGWWTPNKRGLEASATPREELRRMYEDEYGKVGTANANAVRPPI